MEFILGAIVTFVLGFLYIQKRSGDATDRYQESKFEYTKSQKELDEEIRKLTEELNSTKIKPREDNLSPAEKVAVWNNRLKKD